MNRLATSLRFRLAVSGFVAAYSPVLFFLVTAFFLSWSETSNLESGYLPDGTYGQIEQIESTRGLPLSLTVVITVATAPVAGLFAWWWSGKAIRPLANAVALQEQLLEETSHELRTPLSVLSNNAQVLLSHPAPTVAIYRDGIKRSELAAKQMTETLETLLVDARGRTRTIIREATDVNKLTQEAATTLRPLAARNQTTVKVSGSEQARANVDAPSVSRAITNLVKNAIQHAPSGSVVTVEVVSADTFIRVLVTDAGPGIPHAHHDKIFERHWQADISKGSGIGLAIVRQVAQAHGGSISVVSPVENDKGSQFCLELKI